MNNHRSSDSSRKKLPRRLRRHWYSGQLLSITAVAGAALVALIAANPKNSTAPAIEIVSEDESIDVPTPLRTLASGEQVHSRDFHIIKWPRSKLSGAYVQDIKKYEGYFALGPLVADLPIPIAALSNSFSDSNAVSEAIPNGMRAITVKVDAESAVEGWARTGNFVDVILIRNSKDSGLESIIISENIKILSAGASAARAASSEKSVRAPNTVTLLVSQEDALKIKTATNLGKLTFALRGNGDADPTLATTLDQKRLFIGATSSEPKKIEYLGRAKGPDGRSYVLNKNSKWLHASEEISRLGSSVEGDPNE